MKFKKVLVLGILVATITNIGNCLNVCFAGNVVSSSSKSTSESEQPKVDENEEDKVVKKVKEVYTDILKCDLKYDPTYLTAYEGKNILDSMRKDCDCVEKNHRGVCRQFSCYLIKRLRAVRIEAYPFYIRGADGEDGYSHQAVLYKSGGKIFRC